MKSYFKHIGFALLFVVFSCKVTAQKFTSHNVQQGETLEQVAQKYGVTIADILIYNKEIKVGQDLRPNTILVIPAKRQQAGAKLPDATYPRGGEDTKELATLQEAPIGFTSHKVRRKETLYGIAKRYNITEEDIKRYNKELYSSQLKKKMVLRIPKYKRPRPEDMELSMDSLDTYTVAPKETRWSIAHKYGITIDSLLVLNPDLSKTSDYLREGQELKVPRKPGSSIKEQETQLYRSYTVPPKMNFYQLERQFGVKAEEVVRLNPEISERGGLKEGMVIRLPERKLDPGDVNTDNYIFYEVKPKQTEFSLTRKLGIGYRELLELNPALKDGLKAGMVLKLPKTQKGNFEVRNALVLDKIDLMDSINPAVKPKVLFLLPFRLDRLNMGEKESVKEAITKRNDVKLSLGLYSGALIAVDSIAELGISVDVKTLDNELNLNKTKELLSRESLGEYNAIFGPLDALSIKETAVRASGVEVPVVAPIPVQSNISLPNVFFTYTPQHILREQMLTYMDSLVTDQNIIIIADKKNDTVQKMLLQRFPQAKVAELIEEEKNISLDLEKFVELLSPEQENWVFLETDNEKLVPSVSSILNSSNTEEVKVRMFTTNRNRAFDNEAISITHLSNLRFTYPSVSREVANNAFVKRYQERFGDVPDRFAVRGFDVMYDLLLKLAYKNDLFAISKIIGETEYAGNKFSYEKDPASGYFNQSSYIITYEEMRIKELKL
ncbi:LysM peptidoglycan-binding domain-containing protein [Pelagihabitans pacificus]|nr:LysM peptidoglycan-binding domain-containing protein [Pelagihabitans pacificus]